MSHRFSEDELDHLTPEEHETAQPEATDPGAVEPEAAADATQAVRFDPFADEDDDFSEDHHLTTSPAESGGQNAAAPGAEARPGMVPGQGRHPTAGARLSSRTGPLQQVLPCTQSGTDCTS